MFQKAPFLEYPISASVSVSGVNIKNQVFTIQTNDSVLICIICGLKNVECY